MRLFNYWTDKEDKLIAELLEQGDDPTECADLLAKHTVTAIKAHTVRLRREGRVKSGENCAWTKAEINRIIDLIGKGGYPAKDPELLKSRTANAIRQRCTIMQKDGLIKNLRKLGRPAKQLRQAKPVVPAKQLRPAKPVVVEPARVLWTVEENRLIERLLEKGEKPYLNETLLARHNKRTIILHASKIKHHRSKSLHFYNVWAEEELRLIIELLRKGERPQFNPTLLARHSKKAIYFQSTKLRKQGLPDEPAKAAKPKPTHSIILSSMVSPLQRKAIIGTMFN